MRRTSRIHHSAIGITSALLLAASGFSQAPATPAGKATAPGFDKEAKAKELVESMLNGMGGKAKFDAIHYLVFTYQVEKDGNVVSSRRYFVDKKRQRIRVEGGTKDGKRYVVLLNLKDGSGQAFLAGKKLGGGEAASYLKAGKEAWVSDSAWLLTPWRIKDPGANVTYRGTKMMDGMKYDVLKVVFQEKLTGRKDVYWAFVNPANSRMDRFGFLVEQGGKKARFIAEWKGWHSHHGVLFSHDKILAGGNQKILYPDLRSPSSLPEKAFVTADFILDNQIPGE